jgi:glycosyltransferase involved in cell wall biosynthesis
MKFYFFCIKANIIFSNCKYNFKNKYVLILIFLFFCFSAKNNINNNIIKGTKISIFLPIYNKEEYINRSIKSIQKQTLKEIEIIAVNDFSKDGTINKLTNLMKKDARIKIVNNSRNRGLLYSRAMGILNSSGEYLMNLDPDDELASQDSLEYLYNKAKKTNVDILSFFMLQNQQNNKHIIKCHTKHKIEKQPEIFESIFNNKNILEDYLITNKLLLINQHNYPILKCLQ